MICKNCMKELGPIDGIVVQGNIYALMEGDKLGGLIGQGENSVVGKMRAETPLKDVEKKVFCFKCFLKAVTI